jgi:hypothetical protein
MVKWSSMGLIALGIIHMLVLGSDIPAELPNWLEFNLWTFEHWQAMRAQPTDLALSGGVFWATVGSFAPLLLILGALLLWLDRRGLPIPAFVGWALAAWALVGTLLMPPSGFPVAVAICLALGLAVRARARKGA